MLIENEVAELLANCRIYVFIGSDFPRNAVMQSYVGQQALVRVAPNANLLEA